MSIEIFQGQMDDQVKELDALQKGEHIFIIFIIERQS